jgi:hypothetical protein
MMRPIDQIDAELRAARFKVDALQQEREETWASLCQALISDFDAGVKARDISRQRKINYNTVVGVLFRAGRTEKTRTAIRLRAQAACMVMK